MPPINLQDAFNTTKIILKLVGAWRSHNKIYKTYKTLLTTLTFLLYSLSVIAIIGNYSSDEVINNLYNFPILMESPIKLLIFQKNFRFVTETLTILNTQHFQHSPHILKAAVVLSQRLQKWYLCLSVICIGALILAPLIAEHYKLFIVLWLPFDYQKQGYFELVYTYVCFCAVICCYVNVSTDSFLYISCIQIGAQLDCLCYTLTNLQRCGPRALTTLRSCMVHYRFITKYLVLLLKAYEEIIVVQVLCSVLALCITMYQLSLEETGSPRFVQLFLFQVIVTFEILCFCFFGQIIASKSEELYYAAFATPWYRESLVFRKDLSIFLCQLKKTMQFQAFDIICINFNTFKLIMQKSWGFYVALKNMNNL